MRWRWVRWLRRRKWCASLILSERHQQLNLLIKVVIVIEIKVTSHLEQSLCFFLTQLSQELEHQLLVINLLHSLTGFLLLSLWWSIWFINKTLQELLSFLIWWVLASIQIRLQIFIHDTVDINTWFFVHFRIRHFDLIILCSGNRFQWLLVI